MKEKEYNYIFRLNQNLLGENKFSVETKTVPEYPLHSHTYYEMSMYFGGEGILNLNATNYNIKTPIITIVTPSDFHAISKVDGNLKSIKIAFDETIIFDKIVLPQNAIIFECNEHSEFLKSIFIEILNNSNQKKYVSYLISSLLLKIQQRGNGIVSLVNDIKYERVAKAIKHLNNNFIEPVSLKSTAEKLSVTPQYLSKIFKEIMGISFAQYLIKLRLHYGKELLTNKNLSVTEISFLCGYQNVSHFFRSFKHEFGTTPKLYRKNY